ncbi:MAG TPA: RNA methyltransferase [Terriglobales bacterium]|nr:RNA methyltransferase [Terriglobales bacterium]
MDPHDGETAERIILSMPHQDRLRRVSSRHNALVKELRRAFHDGEPASDGSIAIESVRTIEEAIRSGLRFRTVFFSESGQARAERLLPQLSTQVETLLLPDEVFQGVVATETPQGVAALVRLKTHKLEDLLAATKPLILAAAGVQDPGNLGTMIRSAEAFAAAGLLTGEGTVSPYNPKVVRASAGSLFRLPVLVVELEPVLAELRERGLKLLATSSHKGTPVDEADLTVGAVVLIGNEGAGVPKEIMRQVDKQIAIPHKSKVESLNAGIAASIVLYEAARQRRTKE